MNPLNNQTSQIIDREAIIRAVEARSGMQIAEFGCGAIGNFVFPLAKAVGTNGRVYAIDILKAVLENIEKKVEAENASNVKAVWSDIEVFGAAKIDPGALDRGLFVNTLYQMKKRSEALREASRLLKKGGRLIISEWKESPSPLGPPAGSRLKRDELVMAARKIGYTELKNFDAGKFHYGLVLEK
jgi:ubiquinone/menaquinone biosynthesis C-methylase UbiE